MPSPTSTLPRVLLLTVLAVAAAVAANTVGPRRIPWQEDWTAKTAEKVNEVEKKARELGLETLDYAAALAVVQGGTHMIFDARKPELYDQGHLPTSMNLPLVQFGERFVEYHAVLRKEDNLLIYCSGKECDESLELARKLKEQGYVNTKVYLGGWEEWKAKGGPVE